MNQCGFIYEVEYQVFIRCECEIYIKIESINRDD